MLTRSLLPPSVDWPRQLTSLLPPSRPYLDCVVDSGGGAICNQTSRVLKQGGKVVCYGMTAGGDVSIGMGSVLRNQEFLGSTMGSRKEFEDMVRFVGEKKVRVVVDRVLEGLERAEEGFEVMKEGGQFGKVSSPSLAAVYIGALVRTRVAECCWRRSGGADRDRG